MSASPPAAETGKSCWGSGQQDTSAAQGTKRTLRAAARSGLGISANSEQNAQSVILHKVTGPCGLDSRYETVDLDNRARYFAL